MYAIWVYAVCIYNIIKILLHLFTICNLSMRNVNCITSHIYSIFSVNSEV